MIAIYLCDDEPLWLNRLEQAVTEYQVKSNWDFTIASRATSPAMLLEALKEFNSKNSIYFLDVDFKTSMNGMELAKEIRILDPNAVLIFVTTHEEMMRETFRLKLQALDYIIKDEGDLNSQIHQCLEYLEKSYLSDVSGSSSITLQTGSSRRFIAKADIYYINALKNSHKVQIHTRNDLFTVSVSLASLEKQLSDTFLLCHRSILVNPAHIISTDYHNKELILDNGEKCPCSTRMWRHILEKLTIPKNTL